MRWVRDIVKGGILLKLNEIFEKSPTGNLIIICLEDPPT
jgi:hypothetical protein